MLSEYILGKHVVLLEHLAKQNKCLIAHRLEDEQAFVLQLTSGIYLFITFLWSQKIKRGESQKNE
jgi:hypothetical protein